MLGRLLAASAALGLCWSLGAAAASFWDGNAQGWFWYRDPPPEPERVEEAPPPPPPPPAPAPAPLPEEARPVQPEGPTPLSAQWFREHLETYRDRAIDNPTPANVELYFMLQRVMMDKSQRFAEMSERVVTGHPALDEIGRRPTATFGANLANRQAGDRRDDVLASLGRDTALWFFFRSDCSYCEAQAPLLDLLETQYGFAVVPISLDDRPLPSGLFGNYIPDAGQAQRLGVQSTPSLFLVRPDTGTVSALSRGLLSLAQLHERIVVAAVREGWITEDDAAATRAVAELDLLPGLAPNAPSDPQAMLQYLRALSTSPSAAKVTQ